MLQLQYIYSLCGVVLLYLFNKASGCSVIKLEYMEMEEILKEADIVVYGREIGTINHTKADGFDTQDSVFEVYCVLKNDDESKPIPKEITYLEVYPQHTCSNTEITPGTDYVLATKRYNNGFTWDEVNSPPDGAEFEATECVLYRVGKMKKGLDDTFIKPDGADASPACPAKITDDSETAVEYEHCGGAEIGLPSIRTVMLIMVLNILYINSM